MTLVQPGSQWSDTSASGLSGKELVPMVTYADFIQFIIMLCAVITLVIFAQRKKQRPLSGKLRRYFLANYLPTARPHLAISSLVKCIICQTDKIGNPKILTASGASIFSRFYKRIAQVYDTKYDTKFYG